ncbi:MAG TPA: IPT/TIG domain-containing protein, partial [Thermoanaerobaculia bacterium]|nr:IPT/TIG domain-containing protein [Thermoanaerobaculia bacterium]
VPVPPPALPVLRIPIWPVPAGRPEIERIEPPALDDAPGAGFTIYGDNLSGPGTTVRIGARPATPSKMSPGALTVALPDGLRIGTVGVQVVRAEAPAEHWIVESNPFALLLRPRVSGAPSYAAEAPAGSSAPSPAIYVPVSPAAAPGQVAQLYLDESDPPADRPARGYSVAIGALREMTTLLAFPAAGVAAGSYLVRIVIDGATSLLAIDTDPASPTYGRYASPLVSVPQTDASAEGAP